MLSALSSSRDKIKRPAPSAATILVVEDDADVQDVVVQYLTEQGYRVLTASDGETALEILSGDETIDLLLADIVMPGPIDGLALARASMRLRPAMKVLHVTGHTDRIARRVELAARGELLPKPFRQAELVARITRLLSSWSVRRNPVLRRAYDYWLEKCAGRPFPARADLDPAEIKDVLPHLTIVERTGSDARPRFRYRLVGTAVVDAVGRDRTGGFADEVLDRRQAEFLCGLWRDVCVSGCPIYAASAYDNESDDPALADEGLSRERLLLPFSLDGSGVSQIVTAQTFDWKRRAMTVHQLEEQGRGRTDTVERLPGL